MLMSVGETSEMPRIDMPIFIDLNTIPAKYSRKDVDTLHRHLFCYNPILEAWYRDVNEIPESLKWDAESETWYLEYSVWSHEHLTYSILHASIDDLGRLGEYLK